MPDPKNSTPPGVTNAFHPDFLARFSQYDEPTTAAEAEKLAER